MRTDRGHLLNSLAMEGHDDDVPQESGQSRIGSNEDNPRRTSADSECGRRSLDGPASPRVSGEAQQGYLTKGVFR